MVRLVTPAHHKSRFDTQFFVIQPRNDQFFNVHAGIGDSKLANNSDTLIPADEYETYTWTNPAKIMKMYLNRDLNLAFHQFIITNILLSFKKSKDFIDYLQTIQYNCLNTYTEDIIAKRCLTFPFNVSISEPKKGSALAKRGISQIICLESDFDYPFLETLKAQKGEQYKKELKNYYSNIHNDPNSRFRFYVRKMNRLPWVPLEVEMNIPYEMPLKLFKCFQEIKAQMGYGTL